MFRHCGSFRAGDAVPTWLLDAEPSEASAERPDLIWNVDAHVIETERGFFVVPMEIRSGSLIGARGGRNAAIFAAGREVILPFQFQVLTPDDGGGQDEPTPVSPLATAG